MNTLTNNLDTKELLAKAKERLQKMVKNCEKITQKPIEQSAEKKEGED